MRCKLKLLWKTRGALVAILVLSSSSVCRAETWYCEYDAYRHDGSKVRDSFHVEGSHLLDHSGDVIVDYQILENSKTAVVAAKGRGYASEPWVMGFLVMIRKDTGGFLLVTASMGDTNARQTGTCRLVEENTH